MKKFNTSNVPRAHQENGCFPKGNIPWNKGTKGLTGANSGSFKKGESKPKYPIGTVTIRYDHKDGTPPIKWIKIAEPNQWRELRRHKWELERGPIPKGMIVTSIDGDTLNCDISNLKLITRAENAIRNCNHKKASESMKKTWALRKKWRAEQNKQSPIKFTAL